jgi:hypothetical protein
MRLAGEPSAVGRTQRGPTEYDEGMNRWTAENYASRQAWPLRVSTLAERFPPRTKWVRVDMHHDGDWFEPSAYRDTGDVLMQRISGIQGQPVGPPTWFHASSLEPRKR